MSAEAAAWALRQTAGSPEAKLLLVLLGDAAGAAAECVPVFDRLAQRAELTPFELHENLLRLKARGLICEIEPSGDLIILPIDDVARSLAAEPERAREMFADFLAARRAQARSIGRRDGVMETVCDHG